MTDANPTADDVMGEDAQKAALEENLKSRPTWLRFLFMVLFAVVFYVTAFVGFFVVAIGFLFVLFTGDVNEKLKGAGQVIASYLYDIVRYLTYNTDTRPYPFDDDLRAAERDAD